MHILINGKLIKTKDVSINPMDQGFFYGYGLFETIKFQNKKLLFFKEHVDRFRDGCERLRLPIDFNINMLEDYCHKVMEVNHLSSGALKFLYASGSEKNHLIITVRENKYTEEDYRRGFKVTFSEVKRNPYAILTYVKSNNYVENLIARKKAIGEGYDEVLFENFNRELCEGAISNMFFIRNNIIYTPTIDCGILPGILRSKIIDIAMSLNLKIELGRFTKEELLRADEIFLTNSLMEIMPVVKIANKKLDLDRNLITKKLTRAYMQCISTLK